MKKTIMILLSALFLLVGGPLTVHASEQVLISSTVEFEDDGYYVTEIRSDLDLARVDTEINNGLLRATTTKTKSGSKSITFYNASGVSQWKMTLSGSFTYTGSSSKATSASCSVSIYDSAWSIASKSASYSSNSASATAKMNRKFAGVVTQTESKSLKLTCDKKGTLS